MTMDLGICYDLACRDISRAYDSLSSSVGKTFEPLCSTVTQAFASIADRVETATSRAQEFLSGFFSNNASENAPIETRDASTQTGFNREVTCTPIDNAGNFSIIIEKRGVVSDLVVDPQGSFASAIKDAIGTDKKMHIEFHKEGNSSADLEFDLEIDTPLHLVKISGEEKYFSSYEELLKFVAGKFKSQNQEFYLLVKTY